MKDFFKFMFASMLGTLILFVISSLIFFGIMISLISAAGKVSIPVKENSVLQMKLDNTIYDRTGSNPLENFDFSSMKASSTPGLNDILKCLKKASDDDRIKGVFLDLSEIPAGIATIEEIRNAVLQFKKSGKFVVAYGETYSQPAYYLATVADKIYINPEGSLIFKGLNVQLFFMKGLMEKIEVKPQVIRHGKFKSAAEPFINDKMSPENREQITQYVTSLWEYMLKGISEARKLDIAYLNNLADSLLVISGKDALKYKLVDALRYKDEILAEMNKELGQDSSKEINFISLLKYSKAIKAEKTKFAKDKIAVIYAQGEIVSGESDERTIGSEKFSEALRQARTDKNVKAIVLRVNSPGGSALASEVILREVKLAAKEKPVVVSMGDVAASGGYYISCAATKILASPNTLTGSIGVFGLIPNMENFFKNKLGITFDQVNTNKNSDFISVTRTLPPYQEAIMKKEIDNIYKTFVKHVAEGRKLTEAQVDSIGQGRIWSGTDAKKIGLIDDFGGLEQAVEEAAKLANLTDYKIAAYPKQKDVFTQLIEQLSGEEVSSNALKKELGENYIYYDYLKSVSKMRGVQARLPYDFCIY